MPSYWSKKNERHQKPGKQAGSQPRVAQRGGSFDARNQEGRPTLNPVRGQVSSEQSDLESDSGDPSLNVQSRTHLYQRAQELKIAGRSQMNKAELAAALRRH